jgi:hypothetical protein
MKLDLDRLKILAERATLGPWEADPGDSYSPVKSFTGTLIADCDTDDPDTRQGKRNSEFIASCSPDVVLALVARIRRMEAALEKIKVRTAGLKFHDGEYQIAREALEDNND